MRIFESWARGGPVVATSVAAAGLDVVSGRELLVADTPDAFASAIASIAGDPVLRASMIDAGRRYLEVHHAPLATTERLVAAYRMAANGRNHST